MRWVRRSQSVTRGHVFSAVALAASSDSTAVTPPVLVAKQVTSLIPIVFATSGEKASDREDRLVGKAGEHLNLLGCG
jgi:hypothetical protein